MASSSTEPSGGNLPRRRRRRVADRPRKVGWQVSQSVADGVKEAVEAGAAESQNAFVEEALVQRLKELRRERVYAAYEEASEDRAFMEDMRGTTEAFSTADRDGLP